MKAFRFPLESVLRWRITRMEMEEAAAERLASTAAQVREQARKLEQAGLRSEAEIRAAPSATATELQALEGYRGALREQVSRLTARARETERQLALQREKAQAARRQVRLLENLKQRRLEEWNSAAGRELEAFAGDSFLARWNRDAARRNATPRKVEPAARAPRSPDPDSSAG